ncbi:MAG: DUF4838 domain-containing protein [Armatimonadota bacterium]
MKITIVVPFENAAKEVPIWAHDEESINFQSDILHAVRCTSSFAAVELRKYIERTLSECSVEFSSSQPESGVFIKLEVKNPGSLDGVFRLVPEGEGLVIEGSGRTGVLYGAYELLRMQGWRWYGLGQDGEVSPQLVDALTLPENIREYAPSMDIGRGFDFEGMSKDSVELYLWMARNRMNLAAFRPATTKFCEKLGLDTKTGGHIFETILDPNREMPSGKTLWEEHSDWFGLPSSGVRKKGNALSTQVCASNEDSAEFIGKELIKLLKTQWKNSDRVDVWGPDTWGSTCSCEGCKKLGNGTDQTLHILSKLRESVNNALAAGELDRKVALVMCSYEGTSTLEAPTKPIPANLIDSGDYVVFYPIKRCYEHSLFSPECDRNALYGKELAGWYKSDGNIPVMLGEYYNVSKFEDLPLLFTECMARDLKAYHSLGVRGMTYMHIPLVNWAMRTLTQALYAQLIWDADTDVDAFLDEYFTDWYGPYADDMRKAYSNIEEAWLLAASWRAWGASALTSLRSWDGAKPEKELEVDSHLGDSKQAISKGMASVSLLKEALEIIEKCYALEQTAVARRTPGSTQVAVNPVQARKLEQANKYAKHLGEDRRLLIYGIDTMALMTLMVQYHQALYDGDRELSESTWRRIESVSKNLDSYYIPIRYDESGPGFESLDALTRTQLRELIYRCMKHRGV